MPNWITLTIRTNYPREDKAKAFSLIKNILDRAVWKDFFYTQGYEGKKIFIKLRMLEDGSESISNRVRIGDYLQELEKTSQVKNHYTTEYERNHIVEALVRSSRLAIGMDFLLMQEEAGYLVHCILENLFFDNEEELAVYKELVYRVQGKIVKAKRKSGRKKKKK